MQLICNMIVQYCVCCSFIVHCYTTGIGVLEGGGDLGGRTSSNFREVNYEWSLIGHLILNLKNVNMIQLIVEIRWVHTFNFQQKN